MSLYDHQTISLPVLHRRRDVAARYLQCQSLREIAAIWHVSHVQIKRDLDAVRSYWLAQAIQDYDARIAVELAKIDRVECAAWEGWERSIQPRETTQTEQHEGGDLIVAGEVRPASPKRKANVKREGQAGDSSFLTTILQCSRERRALLGIDAPRRFAIDWDSLSDTELLRLAEGEPYDRVIAARDVTPQVS